MRVAWDARAAVAYVHMKIWVHQVTDFLTWDHTRILRGDDS